MTTTGSTPPPGQPRGLYQAQDAQGHPTEGFGHAQTAEEAMQAIAALQQPPLSLVQLLTSGQ